MTGTLRTGHNVKLGFLSQHSEDLQAGNARTVLEACTHRTGLTPGAARALLGRFLFSGEEAEKPIEGLSGGERQRLSLAILVQSGANLLILDEPTNHLDVESREALEDALSEYGGSLLLVSHDRALLDAVGTRTVAFEDGTLRSYVGGWPEYLRVREERAAARSEASESVSGGAGGGKATARSGGGKATARSGGNAAAKSGGKTAAKSDGKTAVASGSAAGKGPAAGNQAGRGRNGNATKQAAKLEQQIEAAETALRELEDELAEPSAWATPDRSAESSARHEAAKRAVEELYDRYEALEAAGA